MTVFRDELPNLLYGDEDAKRLSAQSFILSEFLQDQVKVISRRALHRQALVHGHCHHKSVLAFRDGSRAAEEGGRGCEVPDSGCCGMAGSFGYEADHYEVGLACGERVLLPAVRRSAARRIDRHRRIQLPRDDPAGDGPSRRCISRKCCRWRFTKGQQALRAIARNALHHSGIDAGAARRHRVAGAAIGATLWWALGATAKSHVTPHQIIALR